MSIMVSEKAPSENIVKLRVLVDELCKHDINQTDEYKNTLRSIKEVIDLESNNVTEDKESRILCYEKMCSTIQIILKKIKIA